MMRNIRVMRLLVCWMAGLAVPATGICQETGSPRSVERLRDVVYGRKAGMALTLDVLKPSKPSGIGAIFMVSGGFSSDMGWVGEGAENGFFRPLLERGQTVFLVGHGSFPKFTVPEIVSDVRRGVRFIRANAGKFGVDPDRLGVSGISSGGFLALTLGASSEPGDPAAKDPVDREPSAVQAVACFVPPSDLISYGESGRLVVEFEPVRFAWEAFGVLGKPREEQIAALRAMSPYHAISAKSAPTLIFHGSVDELVPVEQSIRFAARLKEHGVEHRLDVREGAGHAWPGMERDFVAIAEWFASRLPASGAR